MTQLPMVILLTCLLAVFATGYALALSVLSIYFKDLNYLWFIITQAWFFLTPIVYAPDLLQANVPDWGQRLLRLNPMVHYVAAFRDCLYHARTPELQRILVLVISSAVSCSVGWTIFSHLGRRLPEEV